MMFNRLKIIFTTNYSSIEFRLLFYKSIENASIVLRYNRQDRLRSEDFVAKNTGVTGYYTSVQLIHFISPPRISLGC